MINDEMLPPYQTRPLLRFDRQRGARANYEVQWLRTPLPGTRLDPVRTVAALLDSPVGPVAVYGTVLPWHSDPGPGDVPARSWSEQDRVLPIQLAEWRVLQQTFPGVPLLVAGDLNMSLGGKHYYGTARGRKALRSGLAELGLGCATEFERFPVGGLRYSVSTQRTVTVRARPACDVPERGASSGV